MATGHRRYAGKPHPSPPPQGEGAVRRVGPTVAQPSPCAGRCAKAHPMTGVPLFTGYGVDGRPVFAFSRHNKYTAR